MHIPDGFLSMPTWGSAWLISAGGISWCLKKTARQLKDKMIPLMGVMSAFVFAAQMFNFPVLSGTSGHLLGGVLASVLLGPFAGAIVMACVLIVQCFLFQDGGLTALGANIFNMALVSSVGGYWAYRFVLKIVSAKQRVIIAAGCAAWLSVVAAAACCAAELALSGASPFRIVFPAMLGIHAVIGIGEAIITCLILAFILKTRPDLVPMASEESL